jgi:hypothetical protein
MMSGWRTGLKILLPLTGHLRRATRHVAAPLVLVSTELLLFPADPSLDWEGTGKRNSDGFAVPCQEFSRASL